MNKNVLNVLNTVSKDLEDMGITMELLPQTEEYNKIGGVLLNSKQFNESDYEGKLDMILGTEGFDGNLPGEFLEEIVSVEPSDLDRLIEADKIVPRPENIEFIINNIRLFDHPNIISKLSPLSIKDEDLDMLIASNPTFRSLGMLRMETGKELCEELDDILDKAFISVDVTDEIKELSRSEVIGLLPPTEPILKAVLGHLAKDEYKYEFDVDRMIMFAIYELNDPQLVLELQDDLKIKSPNTAGSIEGYLVENKTVSKLSTKIKHNILEKSDLERDDFYETFEKVVRDENTTLTELQNLSHFALGDITVQTERKVIEDLILGRFTPEVLEELLSMGDENEA